jgi:hypothetical protein
MAPFTRSRQAPQPVINANQRKTVNNYLRKVILLAKGNVTGLNIRINQTTRQRIGNNDLAKINNGEAKKLYNKIASGGPLIHNRFKGRNVFSKAGSAAVGFVAGFGSRAATAVTGGLAGLSAGVYGGVTGSKLEKELILDVPALISGDWAKSRIINYVADVLAESMELPPAKIHKLLVSIALTPKVVHKRNKNGQIQWGRNIGSQLANVYTNYSKIPTSGPSRYSNVTSGVIRGAGRTMFPRTAAVKNIFVGRKV